MLHRIFAMLIVGFWLAMTGLLIVREMYPEATQLNAVPVSHVESIFFQHSQPSDLQIYDGAKDVGYFHVQPALTPDKKKRSIAFHGNLTLHPLGMGKQRLSWIGNMWMDDRHEVSRFEIVLSTQEPSHQLDLTIDPKAKLAHLKVSSSGRVLDQSSITLDQAGLAKLLRRAGLEIGMLQSLQALPSEGPAPELTAQQSSTRLNGETVSTYLVGMKIGGQTIFEAHISQLGQILRAQAPLFGFKLAPYNVPP